MAKLPCPLLEIAALLSELNRKRNPDWPSADHTFWSTIAIEAADIAQSSAASDALVGSLFRSLISWCIQHEKAHTDSAVMALLSEAFQKPLSSESAPELAANPVVEAAVALSEAAQVQDIERSIVTFRTVAGLLGFDLQRLRNQYVSRTVLQLLKHRNGIAMDAYADTWDGKSDVQHIADLMSANPGMPFYAVLNTINHRYRQAVPF